MRNEEFVPLVCRVLHKVQEVIVPPVMACLCGADGLSGDPMDSFNLTYTAYSRCLQFLIQWKLPTLVLGRGGYHNANTARCWAHLTAVICGRKLPQDVPDLKYFMAYGPDYELPISYGNRKNMNTKESLEKKIQHCYSQGYTPYRSSDQEMVGFHAQDCIDFLALPSKQSGEEKYEEESEQYGLNKCACYH
ncbi:histone deacetylase 8-like [Saccostrea cucullata]|uniref:histone deacetylase 8-like n=1 Tax=Saccostrea cuccullata TaxID=36930 RepID=UPI002ED4CB4A